RRHTHHHAASGGGSCRVTIGGARSSGGPSLDALGDLSERKLAQVGEILLFEEVLQGPRNAISRVDLSGAQALLQILDGKVEVDPLIRLLEKAVGDGFANLDRGDSLDEVVEAFQVLDVERPDDVDAGIEQLEHVLVAALVVTVRRVRVGKLVDQRDFGRALENLVEAHLFDDDATILDLAQRYHFQVVNQRGRIGATMGFDESDDDVDATLFERVGFFEHAIGLADASRETDVELEAAALALLHELEEVLGARALGRVGHDWPRH